MIDAYFVCKPDQHKDFKMIVMPDNDILTLDELSHCKAIYQDDEKIICHCRLLEDEIRELAYHAETFNPLDISAVEAIGITWTYLGRTLNGIYERYPELNGTKEVKDADGNITIVPILESHIWL